MGFQTYYDSTTRIWSGPEVAPKYNPNVSIADVLLDSLARNPTFVAQINDNNGVQRTNEQIRTDTIRLALSLQRGHFNITKNDVISLVSKNHADVPAVVFAAFALAAPINALDPMFTPDEIANLFNITQPKLIFCEFDSIENVREALQIVNNVGDIEIVTIDRRTEGAWFLGDLLTPWDDEHLFVPTKLEDGTTQVAVIICTSGTSGPSKGVSISHALLLEQCNIGSPHKRDVYLHYQSLFWVTGMTWLITCSLNEITRVVTTSNCDADLMLSLIEKYKVSLLITPPAYLAQILNSLKLSETNVSSLRFYACGGCNVPIELIKKMKELASVNILTSYGMSEIAGMVSINVSPNHVGTAGMLKSGISVKIIDEDGKCLGPLSDGEICVRTRFPLLGYWSDPQRTSESFSSDGWYRSGDIGHFDIDGRLVLVDRINDMLNTPEHVPPSELENIVLRCPGVAEVCVVGVPDNVNGVDLPTALVIVAAGQTASAMDIVAIVKDAVSPRRQLRGGVYFVSKFPCTSSGKVIRRQVKQMAIDFYNQKLFI